MKKFLSLLAVSAVLAGCTTATSGEVIKIGFIGPLTGEVAALGADLSNGAKLAIDEINKAGGVNGRMIELIAEDGRCNGADGLSAAQKLINIDKVSAVIGGSCSGETLAAAALAESSKTVFLSPVSSSPDVTNAGSFIFRNYPSDALKTKAMAAYFAQEEISKVAVITENTDFAKAFRDSLKTDLPDGSMVFDEMVEPGTKDFRSLMTRLKSADFEIFFANGQTDATIGAMLEQLRAQGMKQIAISHDAADSMSLAKDVKAAEGLLIINIPSVLSDDSFQARFVAAHGEPQYALSFAAYAYDAVHVLAKTMKGGALSGEALRDALLAMKPHSGTVGTFSFDTNGDVLGIGYVLKKVEGGAIVTIEDIAVN
jgi:branched-chain amino acid transport system substrate-binding protein